MPDFKPILFNAEMVRAILEGRKTQTRRILKPRHGCKLEIHDDPGGVSRLCEKCGSICHGLIPPCEPGDILWVRETWHKDAGRYMYRANYADDEKFYQNGKEVELRWHPSIHMPKEAARIFLRVKDVRVERLQAITLDDVHAEGIDETFIRAVGAENISGKIDFSAERFETLWDSTIKPADRDCYGWNANPWVWVIEFKRIEKPAHWFWGWISRERPQKN